MSKRSFLVLSACAALLSACSPTLESRGNLPDSDAVLQVQPGIDDRTQVAKLLGSPSTVATFNDKVRIGLPEVNGYTLAMKIRQTTWGREVVLVAVTGWGQSEDRRRAFEAGFDHHLTKPVTPEAIESVLQVLSSASSRPSRIHC